MDAANPNRTPAAADDGDVIVVSCYSDLDCARHDFDELTLQVDMHRIRLRHSVLLGRNPDGTPIVLATSSGHHSRTGAIVGASLGFLLGLLTLPALPIALTIGVITGAAIATAADHTIKVGLRHDIAESLNASTGVVISVATGIDELWTRRALRGAAASFTLSFPESTITSLEQAVTAAMEKVASPQ